MKPVVHHGLRMGRRASKTSASKRGGDGVGNGGTLYDPHGLARMKGQAIEDAMNPRLAPSKVKRFSEMAPEERAKLEELYSRGPAK